MIKILLVEDDKIIVASLSEYLNSEGYLVRSVSGQAAAMKLLAEEKVDLVLLDVSLAEGNGFAACRAIKSEFDLPVIFLTASGDEFSTGLRPGRRRLHSKAVSPTRAYLPHPKCTPTHRQHGQNGEAR